MGKKQRKSEDFEEVAIDKDMPIYTSGIVCKIFGIPIWTLKQLDKEGIVSPSREKEGQTRFYSKRELKLVERCWFYMEKHNVKIPGLKVILKMEQTMVKRRET
jgi:DNA-binding transcriptional MerR regulator